MALNYLNYVKIILGVFLLLALGSTGCMNRAMTITDAKMASSINEKLLPEKITDVFPSGTQTVFCWFQWKNAEVNTPIRARWHFSTDDIHILDYDFVMPRKNGSGSVSLSMPEGKILPAGSYKVELLIKAKKQVSLTFTVE